MNACTIVARNYLPQARVLAESFREHHPDGRFTVLVIDARPGDGANEPFAVLTPYDLGLGRAEVHRMAVIYDVKEFATAVKPFLLGRLLEEDDHAVYFDPDIEVFTPLDHIAGLAREHGIVLTPHVTKPLPRDELLPSEEMLLRAGIYNLGFIAVGRSARPFLSWWSERLARHCLVDVPEGVFVDQRWIDFVPALFDHHVLRDPGCNVAYWNLSYRRVVRNDGGYEVDGHPLRFFHYSGFDARNERSLSSHMGTLPRILLAELPEVQELCAAYARRLRAHGFGRGPAEPYRFDTLPAGIEVTPEARRDVREALLQGERAGDPEPPDAFDETSAEAFLGWLSTPVGPARLPRYLDALYRRRPDLRDAFPEVASSDGRRFLIWAGATRDERPGIGAAVVPGDAAAGSRLGLRPRLPDVEGVARSVVRRYPRLRPLATAYRRGRRRMARMATSSEAPASLVRIPSFPALPGVNVVGYLRAELGVGEAARRLHAGLEAGGIPSTAIVYRRTGSRQEHPFPEGQPVAAYDTNIVCVNADQLPLFRAEAAELFAERYTIGLWFWEISEFPERFHDAFDLVDEVWVGSEFVRDAISPHTTKPVHVVPLPVAAPAPNVLAREDIDLPDAFTFVFSFDFLSVVERKNPHAVIEAFSQAFSPGEGPVLVVKSINGSTDPAGLARLRRAAEGRHDIRVVDGYVSTVERDALMALCDCYVSLHRSEGYGLTMAEAMAAAKPVIATAYSGNLAFMDETNSLLVPYELTTVAAGCGPYPAGAEWAEPDIGAAARLMRDVWENQDEARELGRRARDTVLQRNTPRRTAAFVTQRLADVRAERALVTDPSTAPRSDASLVEGSGGWATRAVRRLLRRLLWPYLVEREAFESSVAHALRAQAASRTDDAPLPVGSVVPLRSARHAQKREGPLAEVDQLVHTESPLFQRDREQR